MFKNQMTTTREERGWYIGISLWILTACWWITTVGSIQAQPSEGTGTGTVLRFKIPPAQPAPPASAPTDSGAPAAQTAPSGSSQPVIDEKPAVPSETAESPAPELSHEVLTPRSVQGQPSGQPKPPPAERTDESAKPKTPGKAPVVEKSQPVSKPNATRSVSESAGNSKTLISLDVKKNEPESDILHVVLNGFYPPQVTAAESGTPRIICDFPEVSLGKGVPKVLPVNGKYITQVRVGLHTQPSPKIRVVLDLVPEYNYDVEQFFYQKEYLYTLVVKKRK